MQGENEIQRGSEACPPLFEVLEGLDEDCRESRGGVLGLGRACARPLPKGFAPLITHDCMRFPRSNHGITALR